MKHLVSAGLLVSALTISFPAIADESALPAKARDVFQKNCYRCHGQEGKNEGGFNYVIDLGELAARNKVVPGNAVKSKIVRRMTDADDPMPPVEEKQRPSAEDIQTIKDWIAAGAKPLKTRTEAKLVSNEEVTQAILADLEKANERERPFLRYFTLTHLHNAGFSEDEIHSFRHGLSKLINSLSWGGTIVVPQPIDAARTILRIDLRNYEWNEKTWDAILARNPYGVQFEFPSARKSVELTKCNLPWARGDWFVAAASRPPLYHDILGLPASERELEKLLRIDTPENIRLERVVRAGFNGSGVSRNNRLIERHEAGNVVYWKSYDFGGNVRRQNLFAHPLGPSDIASSFEHDGGEIIFSLPNGLQAYYLANSKGVRLDKGPTTIVSDPKRPDRAVENGLSCMSCHSRGIIEKTDQVRAHVVKNSEAFSKAASEAIFALYPEPDKM